MRKPDREWSHECDCGTVHRWSRDGRRVNLTLRCGAEGRWYCSKCGRRVYPAYVENDG